MEPQNTQNTQMHNGDDRIRLAPVAYTVMAGEPESQQ
jgi:hypothetical protein